MPPVREDDTGYLRVLARSDHGTDRARLVQLTCLPDGVSCAVVAERADADLDEFAVSADASTAVLVWNLDGGWSRLQIIHLADGSLDPPLDLGGRVASDPSLSVDGSLLAVTLQAPGLAPSVHLLHTRTGRWEPVGEAGRVEAVTPRLLRLPARDGLELTGWWYARDPRPGPTVLLFHGGPEGQARPVFDPLVNALTDAGYAVLAPNVRGSGGFGRAFSHADDRELRRHGIDDVADLVAGLRERGLVDPDRLACLGWSYGGYLALASLTFHPELFATGVSICGMSDLPRFYAQTETWIARAAWPKYGHPERDADLLARLSPLHRVDELRAPVLLVHGGRDTNVPVPQSELFHDAARERGVATELVLYPDEGHEIVRRDNEADLAERVRAWLGEHLR